MNLSLSSIQTGLRDLGYDPGSIDGIYGTKTQRALEALIAAGGAAASAVLQPISKAMIYQGAARYPVQEIILHCADTPPSWMENASFTDQVREIRRWHMEERGWKDIGYHWLVSRDGRVAMGRQEAVIGAHVEGHNAGTIGICLIGGKGSNATDPFLKNFTRSQDQTLHDLILGISMRTQITRVSGHNDYAARACPGFKVAQWLKEGA